MQNAYIHQLAHNCVSVVLGANQAVCSWFLEKTAAEKWRYGSSDNEPEQ